MFQIYPEDKAGMRDFCTTHLEYLIIEKVYYYICVDFSNN